MKYCKKCFRNVREDVNVCPYCGQPGLEEYGSHNSGESFSCAMPDKSSGETKSPEPEKEDAYTIKEDGFDVHNEEKIDAYGNVINEDKSCDNVERDAYGSLAHNDENCHNAPNAPKLSPMDSEREEKARQFFNQVSSAMDKNRQDYYNMLKNIDGISQERIDYLMKKYDGEHSGIKADVRKTKVETPQNKSVSIILLFLGAFFGFANPVIGIIILAIAKKLYKNSVGEVPKGVNLLINIFIAIFIFYCILCVGSILAFSIL